MVEYELVGEAASTPRRVMLLGATGTIGRAAAAILVARGHDVVCFGRSDPQVSGTAFRRGNVLDIASYTEDGFRDERFDALVSCLASRTGRPDDAWAVDHHAHVQALEAAREARIGHFVLVSAICVQKPRLAFQFAKLAFEKALIGSGVAYSIIRPTAYFKSLAGQVERVRSGKPFLVFGNGRLTACKPIGDGDLGRFIAMCLEHEGMRNRVLPVGGPGEAITPLDQANWLFTLLGREPRIRRVPVALLDGIVSTLTVAGKLSPRLAGKAEMARIGRYYATESMLVFDTAAARYDAAATPSFGTEALFDYYARLLRGESLAERGDHAVF